MAAPSSTTLTGEWKIAKSREKGNLCVKERHRERERMAEGASERERQKNS